MSLTLITLLFIFTATTTVTTTALPENLIGTLKSKNITSVHLVSPTPETISLFSHSNISLLLTIPNSLIPTISSNPYVTSAWLSTHVTPFLSHVRISAISVGNNVTDPNLLILLPEAIEIVKFKVEELGIEGFKVSTTLSLAFVNSTDTVSWCQGLLRGLSENIDTLFVNVNPWNVSLGSFKEAVCGGFALKRDLSNDVSYESLDNGEMMDYGVVEVRVSKTEEDMVKKDRHDVEVMLLLFIIGTISTLLIYQYCCS